MHSACTAKFSADANNLAGSNAAIAFLCESIRPVVAELAYLISAVLFTFFYCVTYVPLPALYASECMSFDNR
jgi:hypothetical protein